MPPRLDREVAAALAAYQLATKRLRASVVAAIVGAWRALPDYRDADIDRFVAQVAPIADAGQAHAAQLTAVYLAAVAAAVGEGGRVAAVAPRDVTSTALRGGGAAELWRRPAHATYTALSEGKPFKAAVELGRQRAEQIATTDLQRAKTVTARNVMAGDKRIVGFRRVLTGSESCPLCTRAARQRYHRGDLMPIHTGCDCGVMPIFGRSDPGRILQPDALPASEPDFAVHEHGELGPILTVKGHSFAE